MTLVREAANLSGSNVKTVLCDSRGRGEELAFDSDSAISTFSPPFCTVDQLNMTFQRLPEIGENCGNRGGPCSITYETRCPDASWLRDYFEAKRSHQSKTKKSFLAINIGCNKGYDAVDLLRMGSNNPTFSRLAWKSAMPANTTKGVCGQDKESETGLTSPSSFDDGAKSSTLVYCIEPMPSNFLALKKAAETLGWDDQLKVLQLAMNNEDASSVLFPKPTPSNVGVEAVGISNGCYRRRDECDEVETSRLDVLISKEHLTDKQVNALLIDVEGYDFDVLQGGNSTLRNTEYVEFEFHHVGKVRSKETFHSFSLCRCAYSSLVLVGN